MVGLRFHIPNHLLRGDAQAPESETTSGVVRPQSTEITIILRPKLRKPRARMEPRTSY